jgi:hypothetical protein
MGGLVPFKREDVMLTFTLEEAKAVGAPAFWHSPDDTYELMWDKRLTQGIWYHELEQTPGTLARGSFGVTSQSRRMAGAIQAQTAIAVCADRSDAMAPFGPHNHGMGVGEC